MGQREGGGMVERGEGMGKIGGGGEGEQRGWGEEGEGVRQRGERGGEERGRG